MHKELMLNKELDRMNLVITKYLRHFKHVIYKIIKD